MSNENIVPDLHDMQKKMEQLFVNVCKRIVSKVAIQDEYKFFNRFALIYFDHPPTCVNGDCRGCHSKKQCINEYLQSVGRK